MRRLAVALVAFCSLVHADERARIIEVTDGDTVKARILDGTNREERVRLLGVGAPETRKSKGKLPEPYGQEAKVCLRELVAGDEVKLVPSRTSHDREDHGRLLRYVILQDGSDVNAELIRKGCARVYRPVNLYPFDKVDEYLKLEAEACRAKAGGWGAKAGWGECPPTTPATGADPTVYVTKSGAKYHAAGCASLRGDGTPLKLSQAVARGLKPCQRCSPPAPRQEIQ